MSSTFQIIVGPQHPALREPKSFRFTVDGEIVAKAEVCIGYAHKGIERLGETKNYMQNIPLMERRKYSKACQPVNLPVNNVKQNSLCGCGLAALEMVLRYYGATDTQTEFLADKRIRRQVQNAGRDLAEGTIGTLGLKRGFSVVIYARKPHIAKTFFRLGGRLKSVRTDKNLILKCLRRGVPPIILIPSVSEAYEHEKEEIGHYVVVTGVNHDCQLRVSDPQYTEAPKQEYWNRWSSSLIEIRPISRVSST